MGSETYTLIFYRDGKSTEMVIRFQAPHKSDSNAEHHYEMEPNRSKKS